MAVYKRTYQAYRGPLTPAWSRFTVLSRYGLSTLFDSKPFTAYTVFCFLPFVGFLVFVYVVNSSSVQALLNIRFGQMPLIDNMFFIRFLAVQAWMSFLLTAWRAPSMISKDFANQGIQLYLSRPISRAEYLLGKVSVLGILLSFTTWIPALILFLLQAGLHGHGWGWQNLWMVGSIVLSGLLWIALISLLAMAIAVWVRWRIAATALLIGIFFMLPAFGLVVNFMLHSNWGMLLNLPYVISSIWAQLFRIQVHYNNPLASYRYLIPLWSAWLTVLAVCAFCVWLLNTRLKAREVVRS